MEGGCGPGTYVEETIGARVTTWAQMLKRVGHNRTCGTELTNQ